jgi:hypothetical protein
MREINKIAEGLFEKIRDRFEDVSLGDENAKATQDPEAARFFNFDYAIDGQNYGNVTVSLIDEMSLKIYFSKNISSRLDADHKKKWYEFLRELRSFARSNLMSFEPRDITRSTLKHRDVQQQSKADSTYGKDEVIGESRLYGTSRSSYENFGPVRIIVRHDKPINDEQRGARSRHINSVYVETADGERFKMPFTSLTASRAMARHISAGGTPHDKLGQHICEITAEAIKLKPFLNNVRRRTFEDTETHAMVEAAFEYHGLLNNTLQRMSGRKGYTTCKEQFEATSTSYIPEEDMDVDAIKERFVKRVYNDKMEDALPLVHKAYNMKKSNKFAQQFESWANNIAEGTWAKPDGEKEVADLIDLLSEPLTVGVDAQNATNALYNIIGDDVLFNQLEQLAEEDPESDARDVIMTWLEENMPEVYQKLTAEISDVEPADQYEGTCGVSGMDEPNVNEDSEATKYGVYRRGGSLGSRGGLIKTFDTKEEAQEYAKSQRRHLTPGERSYYKMGYTVKAVKDEEMKEGDHEEDTYDEDNVEAIQTAIIRRILGNVSQHSELIKKAGPDGVMNAARDVASFHAPVEELGSSDISIMVREVYNEVGVEYPEMNEEYKPREEKPLTYKKEAPSKKRQNAKYYDYLAKTLGEGRMKEVAMDLEELSDEEFQAKYGKSKEEMQAALAEGQGDDYVNRDEKMKRMGAKPLSTLDKLKMMPSQMRSMARGDSEDDLVNYNKQFNEEIAQMRKIAGLK